MEVDAGGTELRFVLEDQEQLIRLIGGCQRKRNDRSNAAIRAEWLRFFASEKPVSLPDQGRGMDTAD